MRALFRFLCLLLPIMAAVSPIRAQAPPPEQASSSLVIINANIVDGRSAQVVRKATVIIREGKIESVSAGAPAPPRDTAVIDLKGGWLLPGLIDAHVHLGDLASARVALVSGVTTVRTAGANRFVDIGIRDLHRAGMLDLPDVVAAGAQVRTPLGEDFFLDAPDLIDLLGAVKGPENVRRVVRVIARRRVDVIKILATERYGLPQAEPRRRTFSDEELLAAVDEARQFGLPVMAHAHADEGAAAAVRAGVRSIEHGTFLSDETLTLMKSRGIYLVPTITWGMRENGGPQASPLVAARQRATQPRLLEMVGRARKAGVTIVAGSDLNYEDKYRLQDELSELVRLGMSPLEAMRAATSVAAECLMIQDRTGSITPGLEADLVAVDRDPIVAIDALRDVLLVVNNGHVVSNRLAP